MRAIVIPSPGAAPIDGEFPDPEIGPGDQRFSLVGAGIHNVVKSRASGSHYSSQDVYPMVPGVDAVARDGDGRLVYTGWTREPWGTMAETLATPAGFQLPEGADPLAVAGGMNPAMSGWLPLALRIEETGSLGDVLVLGATGASGGLAVQAARALGADRVVAAGRNRERLARLEADGVVVASLAGDDPAAAVATALDGRDPGIVLDFLWGHVAEAAFAALMRTSRDEDDADIAYVQIGALAGLEAAVPAALLRARRIRLTGSGLGSVPRERLVATMPVVLGAIADGTLTPEVRAFGFAQIDEAWAYAGPGRAVVVPD